jgi:DNA-binding GntR family transcriptional regulator
MTTDKATDEIERRIRTGAYEVGAQLPSARQLSDEFGLSVATVNIIMGRLKERGLVHGRPGAGRYVAPRRAWARKRQQPV